jgi:hypothetical protein
VAEEVFGPQVPIDDATFHVEHEDGVLAREQQRWLP